MEKSIPAPQPIAGTCCIPFGKVKFMQVIQPTAEISVGPFRMERFTKVLLPTVAMCWLIEKREKSIRVIQVIQVIFYSPWTNWYAWKNLLRFGTFITMFINTMLDEAPLPIANSISLIQT